MAEPLNTERTLALTLAGGGNRAFYQAGLLDAVGDRIRPRLGVVAACSAGACVASLHLAGRVEQARDVWKRHVRGMGRNLDPRRLLQGESMAPHGRVYWETMVEVMGDGGLGEIQALPFPLLVLTTAFSERAPALAAITLGLGAYNLEKRLRPRSLHPTFGRRLGFSPKVFDARECTTAEELADLILASSATPPFTPVGRFRGHRLLDGGVIDNVPAFVAEELPGIRRNLIVLTRPYPHGVLGRRGRRLYIGPTRETPISRWDNTRPELLDATIDMGRAEARIHRSQIDALLSDSGPLSDGPASTIDVGMPDVAAPAEVSSSAAAEPIRG